MSKNDYYEIEIYIIQRIYRASVDLKKLRLKETSFQIMRHGFEYISHLFTTKLNVHFHLSPTSEITLVWVSISMNVNDH